MNGYRTLLHYIAPGKYIVIKFEFGLQLHFKIFLNKSDRKTTTKIVIKMLIILDFKILSLWFVIEYWWYNTLTCENNWFLNVLAKSKFVTPIPFGSVSCFVVGVCLSNYNLNSFLMHQASYSKRYQWYLMHREVLGSIRKIDRYPIKVSEVLSRTLKWTNEIFLLDWCNILGMVHCKIQGSQVLISKQNCSFFPWRSFLS